MRPELRPLALLRTAASLPPREVLRRSRRMAAILGHGLRQRLDDLRVRSDPVGGSLWPEARFGTGSVLPVRWPREAPRPDDGTLRRIRAAAASAIEHRFDVLGSGPVRVDYELRAPGLAGHRYEMAPGVEAARSQRARMERLLPSLASTVGDYDPIDWHVDFRSGYRWDPEAWFQSIPYGHRPGVDVKVPWELSRLQHVGALGMAAKWAPASPEGRAAAREFACQVVDWMVANTLRRGVNWAMPMDVALRAVSWLTGFALLGDDLREVDGFEALLCRSLAQHGRHIERNLEYDAERRGNHYLANLVGLIAVGAALPDLPRADRWLAFGLQELESEMRHQVLDDGVDFEGSTTYHAFVAEMFAVAAAIAVRLPPERRERVAAVPASVLDHPIAPRIRPPERRGYDVRRPWIFSPGFLARLRGMAVFTAEMTKPDGHLPQLGDQDSGRVLVPGPGADPRDWRVLPAVVGRMFGDDDLEAVGRPFELHARMLVPERGAFAPGVSGDGPAGRVIRMSRPGATLVHFPDSGMSVGRAGPLFLTTHNAKLSRHSPGGHFHNDLLGFELQWDGVDLVVDPGCLVYTALREVRNAYRSTAAHSTVVVDGMEQRAWPPPSGPLFLILRDADEVSAEPEGPDALRAVCAYGGVRHERTWRWCADRLEIHDRVRAPAPAAAVLNLAPGVEMVGAPEEDGGVWSITLCCAAGRARLEWEGVAKPEAGHGLYAAGYGREQPVVRITARLIGDAARLVLERPS